MDAELKGRFEEILAAMHAGFSRVEGRPVSAGNPPLRGGGPPVRRNGRLDGLDRRLSEVEERSERRFQATMERMDRMDRRLEEVEKHLVGVHARFDDLAGDMRQRFRLLNDRVGGIEQRLVA